MMFIILNDEQAATVRGETESMAALEPRKVEAGQYAGKHVLPLAVISDPKHEAWRDYLGALPQADIVPSGAWPPVD